jgi:hypothetical protein
MLEDDRNRPTYIRLHLVIFNYITANGCKRVQMDAIAADGELSVLALITSVWCRQVRFGPVVRRKVV